MSWESVVGPIPTEDVLTNTPSLRLPSVETYLEASLLGPCLCKALFRLILIPGSGAKISMARLADKKLTLDHKYKGCTGVA